MIYTGIVFCDLVTYLVITTSFRSNIELRVRWSARSGQLDTKSQGLHNSKDIT